MHVRFPAQTVGCWPSGPAPKSLRGLSGCPDTSQASTSEGPSSKKRQRPGFLFRVPGVLVGCEKRLLKIVTGKGASSPLVWAPAPAHIDSSSSGRFDLTRASARTPCHIRPLLPATYDSLHRGALSTDLKLITPTPTPGLRTWPRGTADGLQRRLLVLEGPAVRAALQEHHQARCERLLLQRPHGLQREG